MKFQLVKGETSVILTVFIQDSSSTVGAGLGSLDQTSSITGGYLKRDGTGVALAVDENVTTEGTYEAPTTAAQVRIGTPANMTTGTYELHFHNDLFTTADWVTITLAGATNMAPLLIEIQLTSVNMNDGVRGAMTALPNAAADAAGGLVISDAGGLDIDATNTNVSSILTDTAEIGTAGAGLTDLGGMSTAMKAEVQVEANAACVDVITVDTISELAQAQPAATPTLSSAVMLMYMALRNRLDIDTTSTDFKEIYNDAGTVIAKKTLTDDGTVYSEAKMATGP